MPRAWVSYLQLFVSVNLKALGCSDRAQRGHY